MSTTLVLVIVMVFSVAVGRLQQRLRSRIVLPLAGLYLAVGMAAGPLGFGVLDLPTLELFQPLISLLVGLIGFVHGVGLRRRFSELLGLEAGVVGGVWTIVLVGGACWGAALLFGIDLGMGTPPWAAIALGTVAAVSDPDTIGQLAQRANANGPVRKLLVAMSLSSSLVAVTVFGLSLAIARASAGGATLGLTPVEWSLAALAVGLGCGVLFHLFTGGWGGDSRTFLATVAVVTFASGLAAGMDISPLLVGLMAGLTVSVISAESRSLADSLEALEAPAVVAILVFAGAQWWPPPAWGWVVVAASLLVRPLALRTGGAVAPRVIDGLPRAHRLGNALLPQGGLSVAIAVNFAQVFQGPGSVVLTAAMVGLVANDVVGYRAVRRVLADAGEVHHGASAKVAATAPPAQSDPAGAPDAAPGSMQ